VYGMTRHTTRPTRLAAALLVAALLAFASAQEIDPRARELLEGLGGGEQISTLDTTMITTTYMGDETFTTSTRLVVDYDNERLAAVMDMMGMQTTVRIVDGNVTMVLMGMTMPAPPGTADQFEDMFEQDPSRSLVDAAERATFDGAVDYGGLLVGDQVTYVGDATVMNAPEAPEIRYVFGASGELLGSHIPADEGEMLMVFDEPVTDFSMPFTDMRLYMLTDGAWQLFSEVAYQDVVIDGPIDEGLFQ